MRKLFLAILPVALLLCTAPAYSATRTVGPEKTHATIQAAVDLAVAGDVIEVYADTYTDNALLDVATAGAGNSLPEDYAKYANVVLKSSGTSGNEITLKSMEASVVVDGSTTVEFHIYSASKKYWIVDGFEFVDAATTGVRNVGSSSNNMIYKNGDYSGAATDHGVELRGADSQIIDNTFALPASFAVIDIEVAADAIITGNTSTGGQYGVYVHNYCDGALVGSNTLIGLAGDLTGILFRDGDNMTIQRNKIKGAYGNWGIYYQDGGFISTGAKIYNNTIYCTAGAQGIYSAQTWATVTNNLINNCGIPMRTIAVENLPAGQPSHNSIWGWGSFKFYDDVNKDEIWPHGTGNIDTDPILNTTNFSLGEGSPAIDTGTDVGLPYNGSAPDMGAFESLFGLYAPFLP